MPARKMPPAALSLAVEQSPESIIITDLSGNIEYVNAALTRATGYSQEELVGRNPRMLQSGKTPPQRYAAMWLALHRGETWTGEFVNRRKDGSEYVEFAIVSPIRDPDGKVTHYLAIKEDITERQHTEAAIHASKQLLQCVIDATPDWIHVKDSSHRFMLANRSFANALGASPADLIGRLDADCLANKLGGDFAAQVARIHVRDAAVFRGESVYDEREELVFKDGERRVFELFEGPLRGASDAVYGVLTVHRDITERRRNEAEQRVLEEQLRQAQKMEVIGHLTGGIAHDFNNILTAIFGFAELARLSPVVEQDADLSRYLERIVEAAARARDLVSQLLTFSQKREEAQESSAVQPIVNEVTQLLRSTMPVTISIKTGIAEDLPDALISSIHLHQVLMNLGVNASDAVGTKGAIAIDAAMARLDRTAVCASCHRPFSGEYLMVAVQDSGTGVPAEHLPKIFDPFFSTKEVGRRSGLGLSVLHGIVHSANGHVEVETRLGAGTQFRVYLPFRPAAAGAAVRDAGPSARGEHVRGRVLVVDDEPAIVEFMTALLENIGCAVRGAATSAEAWTLFEHAPQDVDLVITDQTMADMTGAELARAMLAVRPDLPIVLCTGYSAAIDEAAARAIGIRRLLRKPIPAQVLRDLAAQYLPRQEPGENG